MDSSAFDTLVRSYARFQSRRQLLTRLTALLPVTSLGLVVGQEAEARGKHHGRNRGHHPGQGKDQRKGQRKDPVDDQEDDSCGGGCPTGQICCGPDVLSNYSCCAVHMCMETGWGDYQCGP